jgi:fused signal recognition particle receptor
VNILKVFLKVKIFNKTIKALFKSKSRIRNAFSKIVSFSKLTSTEREQIEECLLSADVGWELTEKIIKNLESSNPDDSWEDNMICSIKSSVDNINTKYNDFKRIVIIVGVNGSGKTTSAVKLAQYFKLNNKKITLVAADTYRPAAIEQLKIWADRININLISNLNTSDPASIAYDGSKSGMNKAHDHIIIDTAGRLHTSKNLMNELSKIFRVVKKLTDEVTVCLSIDGNTGQNGLKQVEEFSKYLPIDNIILNKMDGTAKGGIVLSILNNLSLPLSFLGFGEQYDDFEEFDIDKYLDTLIRK